jgi:hypothetical protein
LGLKTLCLASPLINQLKIQINQRVDDRFNSAISLLGSSETSARTGAIYALCDKSNSVALKK